MMKTTTMRVGLVCGAALGLALVAGGGEAYAQAPARIAPVRMEDQKAPVLTEDQMSDTQAQLIKLLRVSPMLTLVVERDPSLLADQAYVVRTNPQLAEFLTVHPEVARNPDFYLFNGIEGGHGGRRHEVLDRKVWPEFHNADNSATQDAIRNIGPMLLFLCVLGALLWLTHVFLENRRWNRSMKLQMETHQKLIDRFSSNQELLTYMDTDAGKRFLESGPMPVDFNQPQRMPITVSRVLNPLQVGVVMSLLGIGFLLLRNSVHSARPVFLIAGMVVLMPGLGFIISAGLTWLLAGRLGMIPTASTTQDRV